MMSRLLTSTVALSVALSTFQPLPLLAQQAKGANCTDDSPENCPPLRPRGEKRPAEVGDQQERRNRKPDEARQQTDGGQKDGQPAGQQRQKRAAEPDDSVRSDRPAGRSPEAGRPAGPTAGEAPDRPRRAAPERAPAEDGSTAGTDMDGTGTGGTQAPAGRERQQQRRADPDRDAGEIPRAAPQRSGETPGMTEPGRAGENPGVAEPGRAGENTGVAAPGRAGEIPRSDRPGARPGGDGPDGEELRRRLQEDAEGRSGRARDRSGETGAGETGAGETGGAGATGAGGRSPEAERSRREEARRSLSRVLEDEDGSTSAAAAAEDAREAAQEARRAARRAERITEANTRSSNEEFPTRAGDTRVRNEDDDDDDDDGGLSNFEKFGLLALGGLAVGMLLNNNRDKVVSNSGDRVVVQRQDGTYAVLKDDDTLLRRPGSEVVTQSYDDGSTRSIVTREDGTQIVTIRDASGRVLRRSAIDRAGREVILIDDLAPVERVDISRLPAPAPVFAFTGARDQAGLRDALEQARGRDLGRSYSLRQIRDYREVRALAPAIDVDRITFDSGSAAIRPDEAEKLATLGQTISDMIAQRPDEMFLIEGHTDAVGSAASNLTLSDRRAESVALALTEYYQVPPENLVVQGYGEEDLRVDTEAPEERNRRVAVRLITPLLQGASN